MSKQLAPTGNTSPFDSIRLTRGDGSEYWSARDLQTLLEYTVNFEIKLTESLYLSW